MRANPVLWWVTAVLAAVLVVCAIARAKAHDAPMSGWTYPLICCGGDAEHGDCKPLDDSRVEQTPGGYLVDHKFFVPTSQVHESGDGRFHACFPQPDQLRCLFVPPNAS